MITGTVKCATCKRMLLSDILKNSSRNYTNEEFLSIAYIEGCCRFCNILLFGQCRLCYKVEGDQRMRNMCDEIINKHTEEHHASVDLS